MLKKIACFSLLSALLVTPTMADTDVIVEDFESYVNDDAMRAVWVPTGTLAQPPFLFEFSTEGQPYTDITPPDPGSVDGKAVFFDGTTGGIAKYATAFSAVPSETQNVVVSVDLAHDQQNSNKRLTLGLRNSNAENIIELGFYNAFPQGPNGEFFQFGYRAVNIPGSGSTPENNGWHKSTLPENMDQLFEIGQKAFHTFEATISLTDITFKVDLFGDGLNNGTGEAGWDAIDVNPGVVTANGFNDIRFGGPSGITSASPFLGVDNISLRLVDIENPSTPGDYDIDGDVDGRDFLFWQRGNSDNPLSSDDLILWQNNYPTPAPGLAAVAVPEPGSMVLIAAVASALIVSRRR